MSLRLLTIASVLALALAGGSSHGSAQEKHPPSKWESAIQAFEKDARSNPPEPGQILFVGSSSIRLWKSLKDDFPGVPLIQRGFGGSQISDCIHFADRLILSCKPRQIILYAGDNDINAGKSPQEVFQDFVKLTSMIQEKLPQTRVGFIAIKPSLARWALRDKISTANLLVQRFSQEHDTIDFIDIYQAMLGDDGKPQPDLFLKDGLHLNAKGYAIWTTAIRPYLK